jgi:hypothetical protein
MYDLARHPEHALDKPVQHPTVLCVQNNGW